MPIIFASSLLMFPDVALQLAGQQLSERGVAGRTCTTRSRAARRSCYNVLYVVLIYFFCYFWTAITFNPKDMADNLKNYGTSFPAIGPASARPTTWKK